MNVLSVRKDAATRDDSGTCSRAGRFPADLIAAGEGNDGEAPPANEEGTSSPAKDKPSEASDTQKEDKDFSPEATPPRISKLLGLGRPELPALGLALLVMVAAEAATLITPLLIAVAYDTLVDPNLDNSTKMGKISETMVKALLIHLAGMLCGFVRSSIMGVAGERVVSRLRNSLFSSILRQEIAFFDDHKTGELVSRLGSDTTLVQQATSMALPEVILGVVKVATCVGLMFWISPELAGAAVGLTFALFALCVPFGRAIGALAKSYQDALGEAQNRSTEALGAMRTVQSFAAEGRERERYRAAIGDPDLFGWWFPGRTDERRRRTTYGVGYRKSIWTAAFFVFLFGFGFGSLYIALWYGFKLVIDGKMTLGDLTAFQSYIFQIGGGLGHVSRFVSQLIEARGASGRIFHLLERVPAIPAPRKGEGDTSGHDEGHGASAEKGCADIEKGPADAGAPHPPLLPLRPKSMEGAVEFRDVGFSYPSRPDVPVLRDFSVRVPPNTTAAIVGSSGAGKSTVVALLQRFYEVDAGAVLIDGNDVRSLDLKWMRSRIGYVQQEPQLFGRTVRENVSYGIDRDATDDEIEAVCREANAHDFVAEWPEGYDTMVGERGVKLSGGQKQRLAISRALLVNPRILLLDEATSALDAESEHLVQSAIDRAMVGRTVVIVAHRLSTIKGADQIVVLDGQHIADVGTHEKLLRRCSKYQDLIRRQTAGRVELEEVVNSF